VPRYLILVYAPKQNLTARTGVFACPVISFVDERFCVAWA
jgi:hypothetical protein